MTDNLWGFSLNTFRIFVRFYLVVLWTEEEHKLSLLGLQQDFLIDRILESCRKVEVFSYLFLEIF